jgi:hypothetical protein
VDHVGIYVGDGKVIHSSINDSGVTEVDLEDSSAFKNIVGYGRIIESEEARFVIEIPSDRSDIRSPETLLKNLS